MNYAKDPEIRDIIKQALKEDIGRGDITTQFCIPRDTKIEAIIVAHEKGIVCGMDIAKLVFKSLDNNIRFSPNLLDGDKVNKGKVLARLYGRASSILSSERVALNFLGFLSGIATRTQQFVKKIESYNVKLMDTRKTLPGLRRLEKYAVKVGGGFNHRLRLDEMVLIKDNHLIASCVLRLASGVKKIIETVKEKNPKNIKLEIEVRNLKEFKEALEAKPDIIMLDNMKINDIKKAVVIRPKDMLRHAKRKTLIEASGNINLDNIRAYAATGIDFISLGTLTKDIHSLDLSLEVKEVMR